MRRSVRRLVAPGEVVFDRAAKRRQREAGLGASYLREAVAEQLVDRLRDVVASRSFPAALDVGCHTGHVRRALEGFGGITSLAQCDMAAGVVEENRRRAEREGDGGLELSYAVGDEECLPYEPYSFDIVLSSLALHWVNNLPLALFNIRHMLKSDGVFVGALLGGGTLEELGVSFAVAEEERTGGIGPHASPATRIADCGALMQQAGFNLITVDVDKLVVDYADAFLLLDDLHQMGEQHAPASTSRAVSKDTFLAMAAAYHALFPAPPTSAEDENPTAVRATFEVIYLIGWAPDASQPTPLRRGTATKRIGETLVK